jgi:hypothetical protein
VRLEAIKKVWYTHITLHTCLAGESLYGLRTALVNPGWEAPDIDRQFWIERLEASEDNCDIEEDTGQVSTGVEIVLQMSDKTSTCFAIP